MKKSKIITSSIVMITLIVASCIMFGCVGQIKVNHQDIKVNYSQNLLNGNYIPESIYAVANQLDQNKDGFGSYITAEQKEQFINNTAFQEDLLRLMKELESSLNQESNLNYYAYKNDSSTKIQRKGHKDISNIESDKQLQKKYDWYMKVEFDENKEATFHFLSEKGATRIHYEQQYSDRLSYFREQQVWSGYTDENGNDFNTIVPLEAPSNMTMIFAIAKNIVPSYGNIYDINNDVTSNYYERGFIPMAGILSLAIMMIAFIIPIRFLKEIKLLELLAKIKAEILVAFPFVLGSIGIIALLMQISRITINGDFHNSFMELGLTKYEELLTFLMNVLPWMLFFFIVFFAAYMIKYIFDKGFKTFIKENTLIAWVYYKLKYIIDSLLRFDLNNPTNKALLKIVIVNALIVMGISFLFVFGFIFTIVYSVVLFFILRNKFDDIKKDYNVLFKATKKLSNGDFDIDINEDIGVFNSLRDEFSNIKDGFEKAVSEEVKSQRMKTELVSNVSHDLKTPLTSIITYTDLLKNGDISEQERKEYLDTLERNSLRLKNIIDDLFEMSKVNSGNVSLNTVEVDIVSLIKQAHFECLDKLNEKNLKFKLNFEQDKIVHLLDSSKTYRIFENLFVNISKYALANTRVYIDVRENDDDITIIFKNISENAIQIDGNELVERFVQGDESRNAKGSGLGLAIAKSFTELQNGKFVVDVDGDLFKVIVTFKK